jgi:hypothetical protein
MNPQVIQTVGSPSLSSAPLVQYSLSIPGVSTAIIGIGRVDQDAAHCQLQQNWSAAQAPAPLDRKELEQTQQLAASVLEGRTNYFQLPAEPLGAPRNVALQRTKQGDSGTLRLSWHMAYAADAPITHYSIQQDEREIGTVPHQPQLTKAPFTYELPHAEGNHSYRVTTVDARGRTATSDPLKVS